MTHMEEFEVQARLLKDAGKTYEEAYRILLGNRNILRGNVARGRAERHAVIRSDAAHRVATTRAKERRGEAWRGVHEAFLLYGSAGLREGVLE